MARETRKRKSETLTIRLDPKTRFILEFLSRLKGQSITTVVERAIVKAADDETLVDHDDNIYLGWKDLWDVSEGVRALKIAARPELFPTYEEEKRLAFCREHWPFFWVTSSLKEFQTQYVDVLWPRIDEYIQIHEEQKTTNFYAAGTAMKEALQIAKLDPPNWPPSIDDEIPF